MVSIDVKGQFPTGTYLFEPKYSSATREIATAGGTYAHLVDEAVSHIQIANDSDEPLLIGHHVRLGDVVDLAYEGCYHVDPTTHSLAARAKPAVATPDLSLAKPIRSTQDMRSTGGLP